MITITRRLEIDVGHRVFGHEGKCAKLHGHRLTVEAEATAPKLDRVGRVIDFGAIKQRLGSWLDEKWDHGFILWGEDEAAIEAVLGINGWEKTFLLPNNPTSENLANYLLEIVCPLLFADSGITIVSITVHETPNCRAKAGP